MNTPAAGTPAAAPQGAPSAALSGALSGASEEIPFDVALRYLSVLRRYAHRLTGRQNTPGRKRSSTDNACDADDLLQETFARALSRWQRPGARPRAAGDVQAWLHCMMLRLWLGRERQTRRRVNKLVQHRSEAIQGTMAGACAPAERVSEAVSEVDDPQRAFYLRSDDQLWCCDPREAIVTRLDVERGLASLPPARRELLAAVAAGESRQEIARREGVERVTIDARVCRARATMARALTAPLEEASCGSSS